MIMAWLCNGAGIICHFYSSRVIFDLDRVGDISCMTEI